MTSPPDLGDPCFDAFCKEVIGSSPTVISHDLATKRDDLRLRLESGILGNMVQKAGAMEPLIQHSRTAAMNAGFSPIRSRTLTAQMLAMHRLQSACQWQRASMIVVINWSHMLSGAARCAGFLANALAELLGAQELVVLRTAISPMAFHNVFPDGCRHVDVGGECSGMDNRSRQRVLVELLRSLRPAMVFNVNSGLLWESMASFGRQLSCVMSHYAYLFSNSKNNRGEWTGYPAKYFYRLFDFHRGFITDSYFLADKLLSQFSLTPAQEHKLATLESPIIDPPSQVSMPISNNAERPRVFWASRLDRQKRVDITYAVAEAMPDVDFHLWGKPVLDDSFSKLIKPGNVFLEGTYEKFSELPLDTCNAWLYTSEWDGVPNILIDVAASGIPIVGSLVGGTGEVLSNGLSWPIKDIHNVKAYEQALRQVFSDPEAARARALRLREHVLQRRTWTHFLSGLKAFLPKEIVDAGL